MKKGMKTGIFSGGILLAVFLLLLAVYIVFPAAAKEKNRERLSVSPVHALSGTGDRVHFLNTGSSDAILLESQGKFALVDAAEDTDNPRGFQKLELTGYEEKVLDYLKKHAADKEGKVRLDFILGTHSHSDHIGGFDTIILDPDIEIGRAYLKPYDSSKIVDKEVEEWDNQEVYNQMTNALHARNIPLLSQMDDKPFQFGNFTITLFNTKDPDAGKKVGENDQSLGVLMEKDGTRIFLSGDMDHKTGDEQRLAPHIGRVDLLKVGHHGYYGSTSAKWLKTLSPSVCVVTNNESSTSQPILWKITRIAHSSILITGKEDGVVADVGGHGQIQYFNAIHD